MWSFCQERNWKAFGDKREVRQHGMQSRDRHSIVVRTRNHDSRGSDVLMSVLLYWQRFKDSSGKATIETNMMNIVPALAATLPGPVM